LAHANQLPLPRLTSHWSRVLTYVSGAIASILTFTFTFITVVDYVFS